MAGKKALERGDREGRVLLKGGPSRWQGFYISEWERLVKERQAWADRGQRRSDWLDYVLTDRTTEVPGIGLFRIAVYQGKART